MRSIAKVIRISRAKFIVIHLQLYYKIFKISNVEVTRSRSLGGGGENTIHFDR